MIVTVGVNPRDKRNENYFGGIFEIISKIPPKCKMEKIREIYVFCLREIDTE